MSVKNVWILLVSAFLLIISCLGAPTVDNSPDISDGTLGNIPRTVHFTLALKVTNSDGEAYQNVKAVLGGFDDVVFLFKASKKALGDWCSVPQTCKTVDLGTIPPGSDAVAVFKFKATNTGNSKAIPIDITSDSFNNITKVFSGITVISYDKDSSFWRIPVSVNTMWTYRERTRARITFHKDDIPDPFYQDKVEVRDANYRKVLYEAYNWDETQYLRKATITWGLNDSIQQGPEPRKLKFYWVRYPLTDDHSNNKTYGLFLPDDVAHPQCISGATYFEDEIDDNGSGWTKKHRWEGDDVWEMDFVDYEQKSYGEDANWGIDDQSLSIYCGNSTGGLPTKLSLKRNDRIRDYVHPIDMRIGDEYVRWFAFYSCYVLDDEDYDTWGYRMMSNGASDGAHLLLGFTTVVPFSDEDFMKNWADYMVDDGTNDEMKIWDAWKEACKDVYATWEASDVVVRVVYRDSDCLDDYLYGQGGTGAQCTNPSFGNVDEDFFDCNPLYP